MFINNESEFKSDEDAKPFNKRKAEGVFENYTGNVKFYRGRTLKVRTPGVKGKSAVNVDGDNIPGFNDFVYVEALPGEIEVLFDAETYFKEYKTFDIK